MVVERNVQNFPHGNKPTSLSLKTFRNVTLKRKNQFKRIIAHE
jgi:hypothetical protein